MNCPESGGKELHRVTKPPRTGGAAVSATPEEDARQGARINGEFKERKIHWQVGKDVQNEESLLGGNEE